MTTKEKERNPGVVVVGGGGSTSTSTSTSTSSTTTTTGPDRISELPVEILQRILGFLEMDEFLIGTSLVSTKWRNLWKSVSNLKFPTCTDVDDDDDDDDSVVVDNGGGGGGIRSNVEKYQNFVDHVLHLRDSEASKIKIFRYYCTDCIRREGYDLLERLIHNLIVNAAVIQGAQEIIINGAILGDQRGNNNMIIHLNPSIFNSCPGPGVLLRKFSFNMYTSGHLIQFPRSMCCATTQLTHLSLCFIRLPEGDDSNAELHLVCPVLETLVLDCCYSKHLNVLDISAPRLNDLTIGNTGMRDGHFDGLGGCRLEIHTPNLAKFKYSGCVFVDCFMENLPCITKANLRISKETDMVEKTNSFAIKLLKGVTSAESLTLRGFEVFSQDTLRDLFTPFTSLKKLGLITSCNISSIHGMVHILNNCNSIEVLSWIVNEISTVKGDDEHLMLPQCKLSHLKHVCIEYLRGHENEIEFVKFLLKSSVVLEDLIIKTTKNSLKQTIEENLKQFIEEEPSFRSIKLHIL